MTTGTDAKKESKTNPPTPKAKICRHCGQRCRGIICADCVSLARQRQLI